MADLEKKTDEKLNMETTESDQQTQEEDIIDVPSEDAFDITKRFKHTQTQAQQPKRNLWVSQTRKLKQNV